MSMFDNFRIMVSCKNIKECRVYIVFVVFLVVLKRLERCWFILVLGVILFDISFYGMNINLY